MNTIKVLIVIDTLGAVTSNNLQNNTYLVDNNGYLGSWNEGTCKLHTICQDGQFVSWSVTAVSPESEVNIVSFSGAMVNQSICKPQNIGDSWEGRVETRGSIGQYLYTVTVNIDGKTMSFQPFLKIV